MDESHKGGKQLFSSGPWLQCSRQPAAGQVACLPALQRLAAPRSKWETPADHIIERAGSANDSPRKVGSAAAHPLRLRPAALRRTLPADCTRQCVSQRRLHSQTRAKLCCGAMACPRYWAEGLGHA
jgi:hypothetical protein